MPTPSPTPRQKLMNQILTLMGNNLIDIQHDTMDLSTSIDIALDRYRQRSSNSMQQAVFFLRLTPETQYYYLPEDIVEIVAIHRRGLSIGPGGNPGETPAQQYDPFTLAATNYYLLQPTGQGDLLTYELYSGWLETAGKLFGATYDFFWDPRQHKLAVLRRNLNPEEVLLKAYMRVPEDNIIEDTYAGPWVRSYALATFKMLIGQAYEKFSSIPGPGGGTTLNGAALKAEGQAEIEKLDLEIKTWATGDTPLSFTIG